MKKIDKDELVIRVIQIPCILLVVLFLVDANFPDVVPNLYQAVVTFLENFDPLAFIKGDGPDSDFYCK